MDPLIASLCLTARYDLHTGRYKYPILPQTDQFVKIGSSAIAAHPSRIARPNFANSFVENKATARAPDKLATAV